jgi:hypothetical protein
MEHSCKFEEKISEMAESIAVIKYSIVGNGVKGIAQRLEECERNLNTLNIIKAQFLAIGGFIGGVVSLIIQLFIK